jgi:hypothetical protein
MAEQGTLDPFGLNSRFFRKQPLTCDSPIFRLAEFRKSAIAAGGFWADLVRYAVLSSH